MHWKYQFLGIFKPYLYNHVLFMVNENLDLPKGRGSGVLPYMGYIGMCRLEGYGFQAVYSWMGDINQSVWV